MYFYDMRNCCTIPTSPTLKKYETPLNKHKNPSCRNKSHRNVSCVAVGNERCGGNARDAKVAANALDDKIDEKEQHWIWCVALRSFGFLKIRSPSKSMRGSCVDSELLHISRRFGYL